MAQEEDYSKQSFEKIKQMYDEFHRARLLEYVELVNSPKKLFWLNFLSGLAKGLGLTIGTAIVLTLLFKLTQHLIALNIPYLTVWISDWIGQVSTLIKAGKYPREDDINFFSMLYRVFYDKKLAT